MNGCGPYGGEAGGAKGLEAGEKVNSRGAGQADDSAVVRYGILGRPPLHDISWLTQLIKARVLGQRAIDGDIKGREKCRVRAARACKMAGPLNTGIKDTLSTWRFAIASKCAGGALRGVSEPCLFSPGRDSTPLHYTTAALFFALFTTRQHWNTEHVAGFGFPNHTGNRLATPRMIAEPAPKIRVACVALTLGDSSGSPARPREPPQGATETGEKAAKTTFLKKKTSIVSFVVSGVSLSRCGQFRKSESTQ
ncbi:hypothetical protein BaRGS_00002399 [Batillaria attramentaria]|uniref:Uncharacterized protein n=1 Tax=Batillaria attramentaria TaxID=370345 RepID=A0ABD0M3S4_9CAEN